MRFLVVSLLLILFFCQSSIAQTGCSDGNTVYPDYSGNDFYDCTTCQPVPIYNTTNPITMRNGSNDSRCGIQRGSFTSLNKRCKINRGGGNMPDGAGLVSYNSTLNNCPIDDYVPIMLALCGISAYFLLRKNHLVIS